MMQLPTPILLTSNLLLSRGNRMASKMSDCVARYGFGTPQLKVGQPQLKPMETFDGAQKEVFSMDPLRYFYIDDVAVRKTLVAIFLSYSLE
ncbi:hypothetical protein TNCV_5014461 [Trichonephila clavipes]|nr:hypothetical protein TNCV_5014461 [Trichonephila clavipes]